MKKIKLLNFRDFSKNTKIKAGLLYRGPALLKANLNEDDMKSLNDLHLKHIIDFRSSDEAIYQGELYIPNDCEYHQLSAIVRNDRDKSDDLNTLGESAKRMIEEWLVEVYKDLPFDNPTYQYMINCLKNYEVPFYINCSAGKDRTGVGAALIELLLGIDEEAIYQDYLESYDNYYQDFINKGIKEENMPRPALCFKEWLKGTLDAIKDKYGSYDEYFIAEHNLDQKTIDELRKYYIGE